MHRVEHDYCYHVYADGSKTDDAVAFAAQSDDFSASYRLNKKNNNLYSRT